MEFGHFLADPSGGTKRAEIRAEQQLSPTLKAKGGERTESLKKLGLSGPPFVAATTDMPAHQQWDMGCHVATGGQSAALPCRMGLAALAPPEKPVCHGESFMRGYRWQWIAGVTQTEMITGEENTEPNYLATG